MPDRTEISDSDTNHSVKVLFLVNVFPPDVAGGAVLFGDLASGLADRNMDITVRTAYPYYPEWRDKSGQNGIKITVSEKESYRLERFGLFIPKPPHGLLGRLVYEGSFFLSLARSLFRTADFDVILCICPLIGTVAFARLVRWFHRTPVFLVVQDLPADAAKGAGITGGRRLASLFATIQTSLFKANDLISTVSPVMAARLRELLGTTRTVHYIPNWLHFSLAEAIKGKESSAGRPASRPVRLLYSGNIGSKQGLVDFCRLLKDTPVNFELTIHAAGTGFSELEKWISENPDSRFTVGGLLDEQQFADCLLEADLMIVTEKAGAGASFIPSKIIPSFAASLPVLGVCDQAGPLGLELEQSEAGIRFSWTEIDRAIGFLSQLEKDPELLLPLRKAAKARALFYERNRIMDQYASMIRALDRTDLSDKD